MFVYFLYRDRAEATWLAWASAKLASNWCITALLSFSAILIFNWRHVVTSNIKIICIKFTCVRFAMLTILAITWVQQAPFVHFRSVWMNTQLASEASVMLWLFLSVYFYHMALCEAGAYQLLIGGSNLKPESRKVLAGCSQWTRLLEDQHTMQDNYVRIAFEPRAIF